VLIILWEWSKKIETCWSNFKCFNPLNAELNPICNLLALLGARHIFHVSGLRVNVKKCFICTFVGVLIKLWEWSKKIETRWSNFKRFNPLNAELNPICHLLALLGAHHIFQVSGLRVNVKKCYVCTLVGVLIKLFYEMHGATMKICIVVRSGYFL